MQDSLPDEVLAVLTSATAADVVTVSSGDRPTVWAARACSHAGDGCLEVRGEDGADEAAADPHIAVLVAGAQSIVLVQGTAHPEPGQVRVRPERVISWPGDDPDAEPVLFDAHLEEVRSGHNEEPEVAHAPPEGGGDTWDTALDGLPEVATLAVVGPDGFPFAVPVGVLPDRRAGVLRLGDEPVGAPIEAGRACLGAPAVRVHGDLVDESGRWVLHPHRVTAAR